MPVAPHRPRPGRTREDLGRGGPARARGASLLPAALPVLIVLGACSEEVPAAVPAPGPAPGTVLLVDELPLTAEEIAPLCRDIRELYPEYSLLHARRLALTNEFLPRLAARALEPARWQAAKAACADALQAAGEDGPIPVSLEGRFRGLGLALWSAARHLPIGEWSAPLECTGRWLRVRLDARSDDADPLRETLQISLLEFPYLDPEGAQAEVERAIDRARLTLLDPEFAEAVPERWKHRMRGSPR